MSLAIEDGKIAWIRPNDSADMSGAEVVDAGGATIVPAMVDCHSHLTMQGGSHWIARGDDPPDVLRQVARDNARRLAQAGVLWARDVGAPSADGVPLSITVEGPQLTEEAIKQLDIGTDLVKLYMDAPGGVKDSPFTVADVRAAVDAVHARGARVAAHSGYRAG